MKEIDVEAREYVAIAGGLASEPDSLSALRRELRSRLLRSPMTDARRYTRQLESAYLRLAR